MGGKALYSRKVCAEGHVFSIKAGALSASLLEEWVGIQEYRTMENGVWGHRAKRGRQRGGRARRPNAHHQSRAFHLRTGLVCKMAGKGHIDTGQDRTGRNRNTGSFRFVAARTQHCCTRSWAPRPPPGPGRGGGGRALLTKVGKAITVLQNVLRITKVYFVCKQVQLCGDQCFCSCIYPGTKAGLNGLMQITGAD
jgi:hypothetical protein